jgi:FkbM family methyltransferase
MKPPSAYAAILPDIDVGIAHCRQRRVVIQAGGHVGAVPLHLAKTFDRVITAEPDPRNYEHLVSNTADVANITVLPFGFGPEPGQAWLECSSRNTGKRRTMFGQAGFVNVTTIDAIAADEHVDFIQLDVEGAELPILRGAEQTIARCRPVLMLEDWGYYAHFDYTTADLAAWLATRGYREVAVAGHDHVWVPR